MKITIRFYRRNPKDFSADYSQEHTVVFSGMNAKACMYQYDSYRNNHDLAKFTKTEIVNVED